MKKENFVFGECHKAANLVINYVRQTIEEGVKPKKMGCVEVISVWYDFDKGDEDLEVTEAHKVVLQWITSLLSQTEVFETQIMRLTNFTLSQYKFVWCEDTGTVDLVYWCNV